MARLTVVVGSLAAGPVGVEGQGVPSLEWQVPWYLDCRHSAEWTSFRYLLAGSRQEGFDEQLFWAAQAVLERTEPIFVRVQNTKHFYYLCDPDANATEMQVPQYRGEGEESVFTAVGGTGQWSPEERERRSTMVKDFCYYGYMNAAAYRTRLLDDSIPGVLEGREHALTLLRTVLMSRSNVIDFLDSSSWPIGHGSLLKHIFAPNGPSILTPSHEAQMDDTERPWEQVLSKFMALSGWTSTGGLLTRPQQQAPMAKEQRKAWVVAALGYHTSLVLELVSLWTEFLGDHFQFEVAAHILEPDATNPEEVRKQSLCRDFKDGELCGWDARLLQLNHHHVRRTKLPLSQMPMPVVSDPLLFLEDFAAAFANPGPWSWWHEGNMQVDRRLDNADLFLCTEPALLCGALGRAFPDRPIIGYFANPLMTYVPAGQATAWLEEFAALAGSGGRDDDTAGSKRKAPFLVAANTRFLAEQMRRQTGAHILAVRPLATYLGPPRGTPRPSEAVVLRAPSIFWNAACILNSFVRLNFDVLAAVHESGGGVGLPVPGMNFVAGEELKDGASEALAAFQAAVIFPYDVSQMRFYELYALGVPIFLPTRSMLPSYIYRGVTTMEDFNHSLPGVHLPDAERYMDYDPFDRNDWTGVAIWSELTHWMRLPHLVHFMGAAELLGRLAHDDLRALSAGMRRRQEHDLVRAVGFWHAALTVLGLS